MTEDQIKEVIANTIESAIWEQSDEGTFEYGANHQAIVQDMATASAAAVLALVGPNPLAWTQKPPPAQEHEPFVYYAAAIGGHYRAEPDGTLWLASDPFVWETHKNQKAAQAAAQAMEDAAHWGRMVLADMITPKGET